MKIEIGNKTQTDIKIPNMNLDHLPELHDGAIEDLMLRYTDIDAVDFIADYNPVDEVNCIWFAVYHNTKMSHKKVLELFKKNHKKLISQKLIEEEKKIKTAYNAMNKELKALRLRGKELENYDTET